MSALALQLIKEAKEKQSTILDLGKCGLTELPDSLFEITTLETLIVANEWYTWDAKKNKWSENKSHNNGVWNQIEKLDHRLEKLTSLKTLVLSGNQISNISPLAKLASLQSLYLRNNKISDISPLAKLASLQSLNIGYNQISDISPLAELIQKGIPVRLDRQYGNEIVVAGNPLTIPPPEIIEQGNTAILDYFQSIENQGGEALNEAKLIIVGEPGAGKTTLMETLIDPDYSLSEDSESTLGIDVREGWQFAHPDDNEVTFTTNIWDFGGQQIQYMTHQFFLTPGAVYVLVSSNDRKETTANFPYWFKIIHLLGEEKGVYSPVLVVQNDKNGQFVNQFDLNFYQKRYPELQIEVCDVDLSKRDTRYELMREKIQTMLTCLPHVSDDRPARWLPIRQALRELAKEKDHICFSEYADICSQHGVEKELSQTVFSRYLHCLGSLLHFVDDSVLHDFIILNPQWAVDAVYSVLADTEIAKSDGFFTQDKLFEIWHAYNHNERHKLLSLMKQDNFEICYELDDQTGHFIAPQLLSDRRPFYHWDDEHHLRFRFQYKFMPEGIITRLIVRLNTLIANDEKQQDLVWRTGVILEKEGCQAQILEEENRDGLKVLDIAIAGNEQERKYLLRTIRDEVNGIHRKWFRNIQAEEMIPCNCSYCADANNTDTKFFAFSVLQRAREQHRPTIQCDRRFEDVPVLHLLEGVYAENELHTEHKRAVMAEIPVHPQVSRQDIHVHVNTPKTTTSTASTEPEKPSDTKETQQELWFKEWWVVSIAITLLSAVFASIAFSSIKIGIVSGIVAGLAFYAMNPKRRFNRAGWFLMFLFAGVASPPLISGFVETTEHSPAWLAFAVKIGEGMTPWLTAFIAFISLAGSLILFLLDHKQK
jgi:signal recognition particle receptor subunit beta